MACEHPIVGNAVRFDDGSWHCGFDIDDDKVFCVTSPDLFEVVYQIEKFKEDYVDEIMRS